MSEGHSPLVETETVFGWTNLKDGRVDSVTKGLKSSSMRHFHPENTFSLFVEFG